MKPYPVMFNIQGEPIVVVGGGKVALRKVMSLLACGGKVTVIAPKLEPELEQMAQEGRIKWIERPFEESMLQSDPLPILVFGTADEREVGLRISRAASVLGIPCNIADAPELCTFIVPATVNQGDLTIAISTGGASPALARRIREDLERRYGPEYNVFTRILGNLRKQIVGVGTSSEENRGVFFDLVDSELLPALKEKNRKKAVTILRTILPEEIDPTGLVNDAMENTALKE